MFYNIEQEVYFLFLQDFSADAQIRNPMKVAIAIDSFKGSMTSAEAGNAVAEGIRRVYPTADIAVRPVADGGEGTVAALCEGLHGSYADVYVTGPLGDKVCARYALVNGGKTAVMEMAAAAGLPLVPPDKRNPLLTTTYGVGEMIRHAIEHGCRDFIIGIGGSATNDGGAGMLQALGFSFLRVDGTSISAGAQGLGELAVIHAENVPRVLSECRFRIACDVTNPLCGGNGCSAVFGPQKGADESAVRVMERNLLHYAEITRALYPHASSDLPGAGAAGGLGFAFSVFLRGELIRGIDLIFSATDLDIYVQSADIVITGEGKLDGQTVMGKAPAGIAALAKKYGKPVIAFAGSVGNDASLCHSCGIDAFFSIVRGPVSLDEAMYRENAISNLANTAEQVFRALNLW